MLLQTCLIFIFCWTWKTIFWRRTEDWSAFVHGVQVNGVQNNNGLSMYGQNLLIFQSIFCVPQKNKKRKSFRFGMTRVNDGVFIFGW